MTSAATTLPSEGGSAVGKLLTVREVERRMTQVNGLRVALGGMMLENRPATLVRALVRSGASNLFITSAPTASWDADLLIGLDRVSRVRIPHISLGSLGLAPSVSGPVPSRAEFDMVDEATLIGGYLAAAGRSPLQILDRLGRNDVLDDNPQLVKLGPHVGVEPLHTDVALLHAPVGDIHGNLVHFGSRYADLLMAQTATVVFAQVDRIVPTTITARLGVTVPGHLVTGIVEAPFGAHPTGSAGAYVADRAHLADYKKSVQTGRLIHYAETYADLPDSTKYNAQIGAERLRSLERLARS